MSELTEEEKELLEEMSKQVKKDRGEVEEVTPLKKESVKTAKELTEEYYKREPDKRPYLRRKRDEIKKMREEHKKQRTEEKRIYKEEYTKAKIKAIRSRAKRKAGERFKYTTTEKITGSTKRPPSIPKKRKSIPKARSIQQPRRISFEDALGSFGRTTTSKNRNTSSKIDYGLGNYGKTKKQKPIDPFEKLF